MPTEKETKAVLKDLFENKLKIKEHLKQYILKTWYPYTSFEDYKRFGNMFLKFKK